MKVGDVYGSRRLRHQFTFHATERSVLRGGPTEPVRCGFLKHYRGTQLVETVDVYDLSLSWSKDRSPAAGEWRTVQVPPIGSQVTVEGMVRPPGRSIELRDEKTLASVLELAGGLLPAAALRHIEVQRMVAHDKQTMLSWIFRRLKRRGSDEENWSPLKSTMAIGSGSSRLCLTTRTRFTWKVMSYGRGGILRADMRVTDVLSSYKDLLPEPAGLTPKFVRLNPPDFHPSVESFDLGNALAKSWSGARPPSHGHGSNLQPV